MGSWTANYDGNEIRIECPWFSCDKLFVNNKLQDEKGGLSGLFSTELTGHVVSNDGEKKPVKARLWGGWFAAECRLFIDDEKVEVVKVS